MPPADEEIRKHYRDRNFILSAHAHEKSAQRRILSDEIDEAIQAGEVIEDYPNDKYGPSCLLLGLTKAGRPLHIQVSYPPHRKVITVYEPSSDRWEADMRTRKQHG
ncbi:MAG: DUF4258 domain-containing protein [Chloroflexi bacterium]|nr:DUF4258 domain-containing protein [Chloroflexota bacterium]